MERPEERLSAVASCYSRSATTSYVLRRPRDGEDGPDKPGTFDLLGFTIHWAKAFKTGKWVVKMRTAKDRFRRALHRISQWCKQHRHEPLWEQQHALGLKLRGHYGYYCRRGNRHRSWELLRLVTREWQKWLSRRSQRRLPWDVMNRLLQRHPLLKPSIALPA